MKKKMQQQLGELRYLYVVVVVVVAVVVIDDDILSAEDVIALSLSLSPSLMYANY